MTAVDPNLFNKGKKPSPHDLFLDVLTSSVGNNYPSKERDVINVRKKFNYLEPSSGGAENFGLIDKTLDTAIRQFQRDNNLKEDGVMHPGGETDNKLNMKIVSRIVRERGEGTKRPVPLEPDIMPDHKYPEFDPMNGRAINVSPGIGEAIGGAGAGVGKILWGSGKFFKDTLVKQGAGQAAKKVYEKLKDMFDSGDDKKQD
ncbi:MAG: hypothetical protein CMH32_05445 [Micavibrio sp.]|nr:hypothetical protein [Micavibrio sp.]HCK31973.1 hypothetical protein [Rhodospirillaceae bacterium]